MEQKNDRAVCRPGFAIKDIETVHPDGFVKNALLAERRGVRSQAAPAKRYSRAESRTERGLGLPAGFSCGFGFIEVIDEHDAISSFARAQALQSIVYF